MKKISFIILLFATQFSIAQFDINYLDQTGILHFTGGTLTPSEELSNTDENVGLFAKKGYQFGLDFNYIVKYGLGFGFNLEVDRLNFNKDKFLEYAGTNDAKIKGRYASTKFGLNILANVPIVVDKGDFAINLFGEFNAGLRGFNIPSIDLYYNELQNKYTEVSYRSRANTMGYLGYTGGIQLLFADVFGVRASYSVTLPSRHTMKYSVRMTDAFGNVEEAENYLNNYLDLTGLQFGVFFVFGK